VTPHPSGLPIEDELVGPLGALWGKSDADGCVNLLLQHLLDTAAVAELIWDRYLSPSLRVRVDSATDGCGRSFLAWICGLHDVGKATPAFQVKVPELAERVRQAGLGMQHLGPDTRRWRHEKASGRILLDVLLDEGWSLSHVQWVWPLVAGHHGVFPSGAELKRSDRFHGEGEQWRAVQAELVRLVTLALGYPDITAAQPKGRPTRSDQLLISGLVVMADWIASDVRHFGGVDRLDNVGLDTARDRARAAWSSLGLAGGWRENLAVPAGDLIADRFGVAARPSQALVTDVARSMTAPGLVVVEAPMGEGKTEAALAAVEVLAARFGADGVFVGMPTQATSDPMFTRVRAWVERTGVPLQVALLHGKRRFNPEWDELTRAAEAAHDAARQAHGPLDEYGCVDSYASSHFRNVDAGEGDSLSGGAGAPGEWFLGPKRGLLTPIVVGTIDQLLYAATRTRHVMVRYAGLAGKVVVLDEVHAADVYMQQFLNEALRWLGLGNVPVVLLSATLPARQRDAMVSSYLQGALQAADTAEPDLRGDGYPRVTAVWAENGQARAKVATTQSWRSGARVAVEVLPEDPDDETGVAAFVVRELAEGGCALVIRNTVRRAQQTYLALREELADDVVLLHARLSTGHRAQRAEQLLAELGPPDGKLTRPRRRVVVATQVAEQSFDIDADLLITDLAPIDLLLQRAGRLHRHTRAAHARPPRLRTPRIVVTGLRLLGAEPPWIHPRSCDVYPRLHLLRTAALVSAAEVNGGWMLPDDIPALVTAVYEGTREVPQSWAAEEAAAFEHWRREEDSLRHAAEPFLLVRRDDFAGATLEGLNGRHTAGARSEEELRAVVRHGPETVEVVLIRQDERGYHTLDGGVRLGLRGEAASDHINEVLSGTVRLTSRLTPGANTLSALPEWKGRPWLQYCKVVVLDDDGMGQVGEHAIRYDPELGLVDEVSASGTPRGGHRAGTT
jgi:CRISPR-associated endonuclease/helicase Cas3